MRYMISALMAVMVLVPLAHSDIGFLPSDIGFLPSDGLGEDCGTSGLAPYVGTGRRYKCEADYSYTEGTNQLNVGEVVVDPATGENQVRMEVNSSFTGDNPTATEVILYGVTDAVEPGFVVETLDSLDAPSRVVIDSPDYYDMVISWGVEFTDVDAEYADLGAAGTPSTQTFCMYRAAGVEQAKTYSSDGQADDVAVPLTGTVGCSAGLAGTGVKRAYALMGDPYVKDAWCTTNTNLAGGGTLWRTGDEVVVRFGVSNEQDLSNGDSPEYMISIHDMTYGYDEIDAYQTTLSGVSPEVGKHSQLREAVSAYSSSVFAGSLDPGSVNMTLYTATIVGMTRVAASSWNIIKMQCSLGIIFKDTR